MSQYFIFFSSTPPSGIGGRYQTKLIFITEIGELLDQNGFLLYKLVKQIEILGEGENSNLIGKYTPL